MQKIAYKYNAEGYFCGVVKGTVSPLNKSEMLFPENTTSEKPEIEPGVKAKWNGSSWDLTKEI